MPKKFHLESITDIKYGLNSSDHNSCTGYDMVSLKATPLSEMVWSQNEGLSRQYVASTLAEKQVSLLWNTESFNIMISPPQCANHGESSNFKHQGGADSSPLQLNPNQEDKISDGVILHGSSRDTVHGNFEELKLSNRTEDDADVQNLEINRSGDKEGENYTSYLEILHPHTEAIEMMCDEDFIPGPHDHYQRAERMSHSIKELMPEIPPSKVECSTKSTSSSKSTPQEINDFALNTTLDGGILLNPRKRKYSGEEQCLEHSKGGTKDDLRQASHEGKSPLIASHDIVKYSNTRKGKEKVTSATEDRKSISNKSEGSCGSVESCNSKRLNLNGKLTRSHDLKFSVENNRLKKQICEGSCSGSFQRQKSSFLNWVSTITNGVFRLGDATPLACVPGPSHHTKENLSCLPFSQTEEKEVGIACGSMGFKSIFQSLYPRGYNVKTSTNVSNAIDTCQKHSENLKLKLHSTVHAKSGWLNVGGLNEVSMKTEELSQISNHVKECPSMNDSRSHQNAMRDLRQTSVGPTHSATNNGSSQSHIHGKEAGTLVAVSEGIPNPVSKNRNEFRQNSWITRFSPKVSAIPNFVKSEKGENLAIEDIVNDNAVLSKGQGSSENSCLPSIPCQRSVVKAKNMESLEKGQGNGKLISKLTPIVPSEQFPKIELAAASFARRLDVLKDMKLMKAQNSTEIANAAYFFCGRGGNDKRECS